MVKGTHAFAIFSNHALCSQAHTCTWTCYQICSKQQFIWSLLSMYGSSKHVATLKPYSQASVSDSQCCKLKKMLLHVQYCRADVTTVRIWIKHHHAMIVGQIFCCVAWKNTRVNVGIHGSLKSQTWYRWQPKVNVSYVCSVCTWSCSTQFITRGVVLCYKSLHPTDTLYRVDYAVSYNVRMNLPDGMIHCTNCMVDADN